MTFAAFEHVNAAAHREHLLAAAERHRLLAVARSAQRRRAEAPPPRPDPVVVAVDDRANSAADCRYAVSR